MHKRSAENTRDSGWRFVFALCSASCFFVGFSLYSYWEIVTAHQSFLSHPLLTLSLLLALLASVYFAVCAALGRFVRLIQPIARTGVVDNDNDNETELVVYPKQTPFDREPLSASKCWLWFTIVPHLLLPLILMFCAAMFFILLQGGSSYRSGGGPYGGLLFLILARFYAAVSIVTFLISTAFASSSSQHPSIRAISTGPMSLVVGGILFMLVCQVCMIGLLVLLFALAALTQ